MCLPTSSQSSSINPSTPIVTEIFGGCHFPCVFVPGNPLRKSPWSQLPPASCLLRRITGTEAARRRLLTFWLTKSLRGSWESSMKLGTCALEMVHGPMGPMLKRERFMKHVNKNIKKWLKKWPFWFEGFLSLSWAGIVKFKHIVLCKLNGLKFKFSFGGGFKKYQSMILTSPDEGPTQDDPNSPQFFEVTKLSRTNTSKWWCLKMGIPFQWWPLMRIDHWILRSPKFRQTLVWGKSGGWIFPIIQWFRKEDHNWVKPPHGHFLTC